MLYLKSKKGKTGYMVIKVDMAKAYDMVEWPILICILKHHSFSELFCKLLLECLSTAHYSVLINGSPCGFFPSSRGIRQGDLISPTLFTISSDLLSKILARSESLGRISGIKVSRGSPHITHLMYADDLVIYCKANEKEVWEAESCLNLYCQWTGQKINWDKSIIHFSNNTSRHIRREMCSLLSMRECSHTGMYLGSPFCKFGSKNLAFQHLKDKLANKLMGWKQKALSLAGRTVLIKAVAMTLLTYTMQTFLLPTTLCDQMDAMVRRFWWGLGSS